MPSTAMPTLYSFRRCPYAMRARLALQVTQTRCALREVVLRDKPPSLLAASPKATVPVLLLDSERVLEESLDIMLWCLRNNDPADWLVPKGATLKDALALIARNDDEFKHHLDRYKYDNRHEGEGTAEDHRAAASVFLRDLDRRLGEHAWLMGPTLSLADAAIAPFVRQFANTDRAWFDAQDWPALIAWLNDFLSSEMFASVMHKYAAWKPGDVELVFPQDQAITWSRSP